MERDAFACQDLDDFAACDAGRSLTFEPAKTAMSLFMGEFLSFALRAEQENKALFDFMRNGLTWFDESEGHYSNFHIVFLLHLTRFLGFLPNVDDAKSRSR